MRTMSVVGSPHSRCSFVTSGREASDIVVSTSKKGTSMIAAAKSPGCWLIVAPTAMPPVKQTRDRVHVWCFAQQSFQARPVVPSMFEKGSIQSFNECTVYCNKGVHQRASQESFCNPQHHAMFLKCTWHTILTHLLPVTVGTGIHKYSQC